MNIAVDADNQSRDPEKKVSALRLANSPGWNFFNMFFSLKNANLLKAERFTGKEGFDKFLN